MRASSTNSLIRLAAAVLTLFWTVAALHARGDRKDLFYQWALARLAAEEPAAAYSPRALSRLAPQAGEGSGLDPSSRFHEKTGAVPYPPPHPLLFGPLGWTSARRAAIVVGLLDVVLVWIIAFVAASLPERVASGPGLPGPCVLATLLFLFPGYYYNLALGQNALVTLALFTIGWRLLEGRRDLAAGFVLALLSYKPQWLLAAGWLLVARGRPRAVGGLALGLGAIGAATIVRFGTSIWSAWLPAARYATEWYGEAPRQLGMAVDLRALVVRLAPSPAANVAGFVLLAATSLVGALVFVRRRGAPGAHGGVLLACLLVAPHVMYYDLTVFLLPLALLAGERGGWAAGPARALGPLALLLYAALPAMSEWPGPERHAFAGPPLATFTLLAILGTAVAASRGEVSGSRPS